MTDLIEGIDTTSRLEGIPQSESAEVLNENPPEKVNGLKEEALESGNEYKEELINTENNYKGESLLPPEDIQNYLKEIDSIDREIENVTEEYGEEIHEVPEDTEIIFVEGKWVENLSVEEKTQIEETFSSETKKSEEYDSFKAEYTPEEKQQAEDTSSAVIDGIKNKNKDFNPPLNPEDFEKLEDDKDAETMRLMIRIAVKVSLYAAEKMAKALAKDKDTPYELRVALSVFSDVCHDVQKPADRFLSKDPNSNLEKDVFKRVTGKEMEVPDVNIEPKADIPENIE